MAARHDDRRAAGTAHEPGPSLSLHVAVTGKHRRTATLKLNRAQVYQQQLCRVVPCTLRLFARSPFSCSSHNARQLTRHSLVEVVVMQLRQRGAPAGIQQLLVAAAASQPEARVQPPRLIRVGDQQQVLPQRQQPLAERGSLLHQPVWGARPRF
eukprot:GHRQ01038317.1.p1 GENE.GHRQ01038317.1~~GHRQ01038317.1.p1  ORF type:complete len:154 (+),score=21.74 GHRQ01038317.1:56-517(+)